MGGTRRKPQSWTSIPGRQAWGLGSSGTSVGLSGLLPPTSLSAQLSMGPEPLGTRWRQGRPRGDLGLLSCPCCVTIPNGRLLWGLCFLTSTLGLFIHSPHVS